MSCVYKLQFLSSPNLKQLEAHSLHVQFLKLEVGYVLILFIVAMWLYKDHIQDLGLYIVPTITKKYIIISMERLIFKYL